MLGNLEEGLKFYSDLSRLATELREACKNVSLVPHSLDFPPCRRALIEN